MTVIVFLKMAADLGFYFTFAGFFAMMAKASGMNMLASLIIMSLSAAASFTLRGKGGLRFLPILLSVLCVLLPNTNLGGMVVLVLPVLYCAYVMAKELYVPEWDSQVSIFSVYWKIFFVFIFIGMLAGKREIVYSFMIPCGILTLVCLVLLMRSLRHEEEIYTSKKYQLVNLGIIAAVGVVALFLSSDLFLGLVAAFFKAVYSYVVSPILLLFIYLILAVMKGIAWLFSFIKFKFEPEMNEVELNMTSTQDLFGDLSDEVGVNGETFDRVMLALGIVVGVIIAILVFKYLARRNGEKREDIATRDYRFAAEPPSVKEEEPDMGSSVQKVRTQYKRFLKFCRSEGIAFNKSDTSLDVNYRCGSSMPKEDTKEFREIYIEARYNGKATKNDVSRAKELFSRIRKSKN